MHRTASINEYSTRYTTAIDARQTTAPDEWRAQATNNKQGSAGAIPDKWPANIEPDADRPPHSMVWVMVDTTTGKKLMHFEKESPGEELPGPREALSRIERGHHADSQAVYQFRLALGVAKEQARKDLPLSTYTEAYWKCDLHNVLHFLSLRMDSHAQKEIRDYANIIGEQIVAKLFPEVWAAFVVYRLEAMTLTAYDVAVIREFTQIIDRILTSEPRPLNVDRRPPGPAWLGWPEEWIGKPRCRERDECIAKLVRMGVFVP